MKRRNNRLVKFNGCKAVFSAAVVGARTVHRGGSRACLLEDPDLFWFYITHAHARRRSVFLVVCSLDLRSARGHPNPDICEALLSSSLQGKRRGQREVPVISDWIPKKFSFEQGKR